MVTFYNEVFMGKKLIITEKPSVAREFARVLNEPMKNHGEYLVMNTFGSQRG